MGRVRYTAIGHRTEGGADTGLGYRQHGTRLRARWGRGQNGADVTE